eukprot:TRINITY_DN34_c2_g1_i1.p1 TRINITY_DN34_c2_g1~~TRINITY_DN34_c2_g1_i1.p1  ORF type:complete len:362 (-),score=47.25 TRINITY_DN34_c2_g1_i1:457-1542(-)
MCRPETSKQRVATRLIRDSPFWNLVTELFGAQARDYFAAKAHVCAEDSLIVAEILVCFVVIEVWMRVVIPALGLQSGEACPWASYVRREYMFIGTPIGYLTLYFVVCGTMDYLWSHVWHEAAKKLSIQGKSMSKEDTKKAISFACRCFVSSTSMSGVFYHVMRGESNIHWGLPSMSDIPWIVLMYFLTDLIQFGVHVLMHRPWWYQRFHKVHHMWKNPNVWVVSALHPAELLLYTAPTLMVSSLMPLSFCSWVAFFAFVLVCTAIDHSGLHLHDTFICRLLFWQSPPEFHDSHHEFFHVNYGVMVDWWDRLAGTYHDPAAFKDAAAKSRFLEENYQPLQAPGHGSSPVRIVEVLPQMSLKH